MFLHIYKYRLKSLIRGKEEFFWIFLFPLALSTCFFAAFSNINKATEEFSQIPVAVCIEDKNTEADSSMYFKTLISSLSSGDDAMLKTTYADSNKCDELLDTDEIDGIITFENGKPYLTIKDNGINQSILKIILDKYNQAIDVISNVSPADIQKTAVIIKQLMIDNDYISKQKLTDGNTDNMSDYYYSLIAMTCMFGTMSGFVCVSQLKANLSSTGMRKNITPVNRLVMILGDFFATFTMHALANAVLVIYLQYVLKLNLCKNEPLLYLTSLVGSLIGISLGIMIGSIPKISENTKMGLNVGISLFSSFLSGLMVGGIKYDIEKNAPIINRLNPATVISDALYSLNIYDTYDKYIFSMTTLVIMSVVFCGISYFMTRRESYDYI